MEKDRGSGDRRSEDLRQNSHGYKDGRNKDQKLKDHKAEVHKLAEKVCGDWSEHVSSSGKRYYYNSTTEVSQWERPEEWLDASVLSSSSRIPRTKDASEKSTTGAGHKGQRDWSKHSVGNHNSSSKTTPAPNSQLNSRLTTNNSTKADGLLVEDSHRTSVAAVTNAISRSHGSNATPSSKTSSEGSSMAANNDDSSHGNCRGFDAAPLGDRTPRRDSVPGVASCSPSRAAGTPVVGPSGIYGLFASGGGISSSNDYHHHQQQHHQRSRINDSMTTDAYKCDDMDISPGSTPTEESMLEKHASATKTSNAVAITGTPVSTPLEQPGSVTPLASLTPTLLSSASAADKSGAGTSSSTSVTNATVLSTLAALQQAVSQITVDKAPGLAAGGSVQQQQPQAASLISCLALLPPLISQLSMDKSANSQMRPQDRQQNALIMKQAIELLQKLQQALVAQQQLQQQRQLQQLLLQLLSVQKSSGGRPTSSSQWTTPSHSKRVKLDSSSTVDDDDKSESPYSPPDSDGTPLGSPDGHAHPSMGAQQPTENSANAHREIAKTDDMDTESNRHPSPNQLSSAGQPVTLGTSQLAAATVHRKQDSTGLTPSLANYFNSHLIEHAAGWQSDLLERQADCYTEEAHTIGSIHCTQVSVELKRARSMVRANEIKTTLQEQRIMSLCQRHRELDQGFSLFMPLQDT